MPTAASGQAILVENDDKTHGDHLYAAADRGAFYMSTMAITMAASAAAKVVGQTQSSAGAAVAQTGKGGMTVDKDAGTFTIDKPGDYELGLCGRVVGEEDEDVTLEWQKNGTNLNAPHQETIEFDATGGVQALNQRISRATVVEGLKKGDVIAVNVLGSNDEVITFNDFYISVKQVGSANYDD